MKKIVCEMCEGTEFAKVDGMFVCQNCGTKYSPEEAKALMVEVEGEVQDTVKAENTSSVEKNLASARRAKQKENWKDVEKYYSMVEQDDPTNIEAVFYSAFAQVKLALLEAESKDKRQNVFNILSKAVSEIGETYDNTNEENEDLLFQIMDDIKGLKGGTIVPTTHLQEYVTKNGYGNIVDRSQVVEDDSLDVTHDMIDVVVEAYYKSIGNIIVVQCEDLSKEEILAKAYETLQNGYSGFALGYFSEYIKKNTESPVGYLGKAVALLGLDKYRPCSEEVTVASKYVVSESDIGYAEKLVGMTASKLNRTLLVNAAAFTNYDAVKFLVDLGADIDAKDINNKTALWYVCYDKYTDEGVIINTRKIAKLLLDKGASVDVVSAAGVALYNNKTDSEIASMIHAKHPYLEKGNSPASSGCCYVATCVYGSYDCPEVWTLRRFRDNKLAETWYGRAFVKTYYAISPTLVKWFGHTEWFKRMWRGTLDRMVKNLQEQGFEDTPYNDRQW
ncbi:MAG: ankyrin repeat domain-containing protein [Clostridia bacterium]|nr:ankyrin repeat domain-containing protein [Clostridia bacterium]